MGIPENGCDEDISLWTCRLRGYEKAWHKVFNNCLHRLITETPTFNNIDRVVTRHAGPQRNVRGDAPLDQPMQCVEMRAELKVDDVRSTSIEAHAILVADFLESHMQTAGPQFYANLSAIMDATGNVVSGKGRGLCWDLVLDAWEKVEWHFEDGEPLLPTMHVGPGTKGRLRFKYTAMDADQDFRYRTILKDKLDQHNASKRNRKLSADIQT